MTSIKTKRVALYARVSTKDKEQDVENQLAQLREFCERQGYVIHDEYMDDESGTKGKRERAGFNRLFEDASKGGPGSGLPVTAPSGLDGTRSCSNGASAHSRFGRPAAGIRGYDPNCRLASPDPNLMGHHTDPTKQYRLYSSNDTGHRPIPIHYRARHTSPMGWAISLLQDVFAMLN